MSAALITSASVNNQADAHADVEGAVFPGKVKIRHGLPQLVCDAQCIVGSAVLQEYAKFVAAQARQSIALAQATLQHRTDLAHELVSRGMAAGVVDDLELVEVEVHHCVVPPQLRGAFQRQAQAVFEFGAVDEFCERVVARLVGKLGGILPLIADIVQDQHYTDDLAAAGANRRGRLHDRNFGAVGP